MEINYVDEYLKLKKENRDIDDMSEEEHAQFFEIRNKAQETISLSDKEFSLIIKMRILKNTHDEISKILKNIYQMAKLS